MTHDSIEDIICELLTAMKDKDHKRIRSIEDYLYSKNIAIEKTDNGVRWSLM